MHVRIRSQMHILIHDLNGAKCNLAGEQKPNPTEAAAKQTLQTIKISSVGFKL